MPMVYKVKSGNLKQFLSFSKLFLWLDSHIMIKKEAFFLFVNIFIGAFPFGSGFPLQYFLFTLLTKSISTPIPNAGRLASSSLLMSSPYFLFSWLEPEKLVPNIKRSDHYLKSIVLFLVIIHLFIIN